VIQSMGKLSHLKNFAMTYSCAREPKWRMTSRTTVGRRSQEDDENSGRGCGYLQSSRYLRQLPMPSSPNSSL
jgi:hypothetical protein